MRKKIRKIAALALSVALVTGCISGCTDEEGTNGTNGSAASDSGAVSSNGKKTFEDLGGMDILIGDWYTEEINGEKTEYQQAQQDYYKEIQDTYNFTIVISSVTVGFHFSSLKSNSGSFDKSLIKPFINGADTVS